MAQAWHAGVIAKSTSTPPLKQLLGVEDKPQTAGEMLSSMAAWAAATRHLGS